MTPSHVRDVPVRPVMRILKDFVGKWSWRLTRWAIDWKGKENDYVYAHMAFPRGYVLHETATVADEITGLKAQLVVFRKEEVPDPRVEKKDEKQPVMQPGGYL